MESLLLQRHASTVSNLAAFAVSCCLLLLLADQSAFAQDTSGTWQRRAERLQQQYEQTIEQRRDQILQFAQEKHEEYEAAVQRARRLGLPLQIKDEAGKVVATLSGFTGNGLPLYASPDNQTSASIIKTDQLWNHPWNLDGYQEKIGLWEAGAGRPLESHQEFIRTESRIHWEDNDPGSHNDHATHVAGTMIAKGVQQQAHGMASEAEVYAWESDGDIGEMGLASITPGIKLSNHSYGFRRGWRDRGPSKNPRWRWWGDPVESQTEDYLFGFYSQVARDQDYLAYNNPYYLIVRSAGNDRNDAPPSQPVTHDVYISGSWVRDSTTTRDADCNGGTPGYDCVEGAAVAKNVLTVGALEDDGQTPAPFSAFGPTDDGRIKPDIMANGVSVYSPVAYNNNDDIDNTAYDIQKGTSMAAPAVTGSIALLKDLLGIAEYRAATLKALVLHTADDLFPGTLPGPDYKTGWGRMNTKRAAEVLQEEINASDPLHVVDHTTLEGGHVLEFEATTTSTPQPLRVTLSWTDQAGFPPPTDLDPDDRMLRNDLNLRVIRNSNGQQTMPYVLDPSNPGAQADRGDNNRDNIEQVYIPNPAPNATYTLRVSHDEALSGFQQNFAMVVTGNSSLTPPEEGGDDDPPPPPSECELPIAILTDLTVSGTCRVTTTTVINDNATLTIQAGSRIQFEPGTYLNVYDGRILAEGTAENVIHFERATPGEDNRWGSIILADGGSELEYAVIEGADASEAIRLEDTGYVLRHLVFQDNTHADLSARDLTRGDGDDEERITFTMDHVSANHIGLYDPTDASISNLVLTKPSNGDMGYLSIGQTSVLDLKRSLLEESRIYATGGAELHIGKGYNVIRNADGSEIKTDFGARVFGTITECTGGGGGPPGGDPPPIASLTSGEEMPNLVCRVWGGQNDIYDVEGAAEGGEYVYNDTAYEYELTENYWGTRNPTDDLFYGLVNYIPSLKFSAGGGPLNSSVPAASAAGESESHTAPRVRDLRQEIVQARQVLRDRAAHSDGARYAAQLYYLQRLDRPDALGERAATMTLLASYQKALPQAASNAGQAALRTTAERAVLIGLGDALRQERYEKARQLIQRYEPYITSRRRQAEFLVVKEMALEQAGRYAEALGALEDAKKLGLENQSYAITEASLRNELGEDATAVRTTRFTLAAEAAAVPAAVSLENELQTLPDAFALKTAYPNPTTGRTTLPVALPERAQVRIAAYDVLGRRVAVLTDRSFAAGQHEVPFNGAKLTSGLYFIRAEITSASGTAHLFTEKVTVVR